VHNKQFVLECGIFLFYSLLQLLIVSKLSEIIIIIILYKFVVSYRPLFDYIQRTCVASVVERLQLCSVCGRGSGSLGSSSQGWYIGLHVHGDYLLQTMFLHQKSLQICCIWTNVLFWFFCQAVGEHTYDRWSSMQQVK